MTPRLPRDRIFGLLALVWLIVAAGSAAADWPTPARIAAERLQLAFLWANAVDKDFRPYDTPIGNDPDAQYQELVADYQARFGDRFDISPVVRHHDAALAGMGRERLGIVAFAVLSTAMVWWLLLTVRNLLGRETRPG